MEQTQDQRQFYKLHTQHPAILHFPVALGDIIEFPNGIPGFEDIHQFEIHSHEKYRPFLFMNAVGNADVGFICADVFYIDRNYEVRISNEVLDRLECESLQELAVLSIVTVGESAEKTTANLLSPLLINVKARKGLQVILEKSNYDINYPIWENLKNSNENGAADKDGTNTAKNNSDKEAQGF